MEIQNQTPSPGIGSSTREPLTAVSDNEAQASLRNPSSPFGPKETFLEEAERLLILRRLGVDIEKLNEIEQEISELESIGELSKEQQDRLESLHNQREELFRAAMERRNGESLPPGSMLSVSV